MKNRLHGHLPLIIRSRMAPRDAMFYMALLVGAVLAFGLGVWGLSLWYPGQVDAQPLTLGYAIYWTIRLFLLESGEVAGRLPWQLEIARFLAPLVMLTTALKLTSEFAKEFWQEMRAKNQGHILLVGEHELMPLLVEGYRKAQPVVTLRWGHNSTDILDLNEWRFKGWSKRSSQQADEQLGKRILQRAHLTEASHAVVLHQDTQTALDILHEVLVLLKENPQCKVSLHLHCDDAAALVVARQKVDNAQIDNPVYLTNLYEVAARELMMRFPPEQGRPVTEPVRVAIVGAGALGRALCVQMGFSGHYAGLQQSAVVWMDTQSARLENGDQMLRLSYPQLSECLDFQCTTEHPLSYFAKLSEEQWRGLAQIWICLDNEVESSAMVEALQMQARKCLQGQPGEPLILNRMAMVQEMLADPEVLLRDKQSIDPMAKATHENYRRKYQPEGPVGEPWEQLSRNFREANRRSAEHLWVKLRAVGWEQPFPQLPSRAQAEALIQGNEELLSRMEKQRWNADRYLNGWVYGPVRDNNRRVHNLLVPWEELDALQQSKDTSNVMLIAELVEG